MTTGSLTFDCDSHEGRQAMERALKADVVYSAIYEIGQNVFRPARKHGYSGKEIADAIKKLDALENMNRHAEDEYVSTASELIGLLEKLFYGILDARGINSELLE